MTSSVTNGVNHLFQESHILKKSPERNSNELGIRIPLKDYNDSESAETPLIENDEKIQIATLASPETVNLDDGHNQHGVDDGFFTTTDDDFIPDLSSRIGPGDDGKEETEPKASDEKPDETDGVMVPINGAFYGHDLEIGTTNIGVDIPDVNVYQHKKTLAQGMMDLALLSANANQLRYVLESYPNHPYYYPSLFMICISLVLQVAVGVGLIWNSKYNVKDEKEICIANKINNFTVIGIFLVTVVNVFVSAFGVANTPTQT